MDLQLFLVGLLMAASVDPGDDDSGDFSMWYDAWIPLREMFDAQARLLSWPFVGTSWEYHA